LISGLNCACGTWWRYNWCAEWRHTVSDIDRFCRDRIAGGGAAARGAATAAGPILSSSSSLVYKDDGHFFSHGMCDGVRKETKMV